MSTDTYNETRDQIISDAFMTIGVYRPGATINTNDNNLATNFLNRMFKYWDTKGIHMWTQIEGTLFLRTGVNTYTLSNSSTDNAGNNVIETTLLNNANSTTLPLTSTTGMTANDNIGIKLDNGTRQWTTIQSVDSTTQVTIATPITSSASLGNTVFSYTTQVSKPLHITKAVCRTQDSVDLPIVIRDRDEFLQIPNKTTTNASVNQLFWTSNKSDGTIIVWPTPDNTDIRIHYNYTRMLYDMLNSGDYADLPTEWLDTITTNLAVRLAPAYGKDLSKTMPDLIQYAKDSLMEMEMWDINGGSVKVVPRYREDD